MFELEKDELELFFLINLSIKENLDKTISYLREFLFPQKVIKGFFVPEAEDFRVKDGGTGYVNSKALRLRKLIQT